jgi:opacity protein-like surface antigen
MMRKDSRKSWAVLLVALGVCLSSVAYVHAQNAPQTRQRPDLAIDYTVLRSNALPGGCTCFYAYGGSATLAWPLKVRGVAVLGDITAGHAGGISSNRYELTLSTYTVGLRYSLPIHKTSLRPFADTLTGISHTTGSLVQGASAAVSNSGASFALNVGGGLDLNFSPRLSLRLAEIDYLLTNFDNGARNRQNILRMSAGAVFHF